MEYIVILSVVFLLALRIVTLRKCSDDDLLDYIKIGENNKEDLNSVAMELSQKYSDITNKSCKKSLIYNVKDCYKDIVFCHNEINEEYKKNCDIIQGGEWILDNMYILEKEYHDIKSNMPHKYYRDLPILTKGMFKGYPRIYQIAIELVSNSEGNLNENIIKEFINSYQKETILTMGELWALPIMIRAALIQNIGKTCEEMSFTIKEKKRAETLAQDIINVQLDGSSKENFYEILKKEKITTTFADHLLKLLRDNGIEDEEVNKVIEDKLDLKEINIDNVIATSHRRENRFEIILGNSITSLRNVESLNYKKLFESISVVEKILKEDKLKVYDSMDFQSKDYYRHVIEKISKENNIPESYIAKKALECSREHKEKPYENHIGYYLFDDGRRELNRKLNINYRGFERFKNYIKGNAVNFYVVTIFLLTAILSAAFLYWSYINDNNFRLWKYILVIFITAIPLSDVVISILNWSITHLCIPTIMPRIEFDNIPDQYRTAVVVPTIINSSKRAKELVDNLEIYYLANKDENLFFVLLGDFRDSHKEVLEDDKKIGEDTIKYIKRLNEKYCKNKDDRFFFLCRHRVYNEGENLYIGYERKRGKIMEFNALLRGEENTTYNIFSSSIENLKKVKYVITLDADTVLPRDAAKKLVGAMAHPLNTAYVGKEKKSVIRGYGLMQPRISISLSSAEKTYFSNIFSGETGIDIYTMAISDVYQDLFGEGIFTGKGIYDLDVFEYMLKNEIPENRVLSHDLLEGSYVRTGLITDVELIDDYPAYYNSSSKRLHRWVRGDWQLIPWLFKKSPINRLSKWKIFDNLRRSLISPSMVILLLFTLIKLLPDGTDKWYMVAFISLITPILFDVTEYVVSPLKGISLSGRIQDGKMAFKQVFFIYVFLPYQGYLMLDAIFRTIYRMTVSKKNLLQWQTAADVERTSGKSLKAYIHSMWQGSGISLIILIIAFYNSQNVGLSLLPSCILWFLSPMIAWLISVENEKETYSMKKEEEAVIRRIARKTWAYFEDFINEKCNYLGVDNYQEEPYKGTALRTSPTNMGMAVISNITALDLGYITILEAVDRIGNSIDNMEKLEKHKGHFLNWYNSETKEPLYPRYISTVDSGNLAGYLMTTYEALNTYKEKTFITSITKGIQDTIGLAAEEIEKFPSKQYIYLMLQDEFDNNTNDLISFRHNCYNLLLRVKEILEIQELTSTYWTNKLIKDLKEYIKEIDTLFPWIVHLNYYEDNIINEINNIVTYNGLNEYEYKVNILIEKVKSTEGKSFLKESIDEINKLVNSIDKLKEKVLNIACEMDFSILFDKDRELFSIGYDLESNSRGKSHYDLLASEARQASFIAIAKNEVPTSHWFKLGRSMTTDGIGKGLVSWSGTMFEYYMPRLIMKNYSNTLLDESYKFSLNSQMEYGKNKKVPFGISESAYYNFDMDSNYQYKAFGIPLLGLQRGLENELVISPYSTIMALMENESKGFRNMLKLIKEGAEGVYGFYEAIDYTPDRVSKDINKKIVKCYMIHHLGMSIMAIDNVINNNILQKYFHSMPMVQATELLLQEKISKRIIYDREKKYVIQKSMQDIQKIVPRKVDSPVTRYPVVGILSNNNYSVMLTNSGSGYSKVDTMLLYRYREKNTNNNTGMFFYIKDINTGEYFSSTYEPCRENKEKYTANFYLDKIEYIRKDAELYTKTSIVVSKDENLELRTLELKNNSKDEKILEITSYCEVVLQEYGGDLVHPAFGNLFIKTEVIPEEDMVIANRNPRHKNEKTPYMVQCVVVEGEVIGALEYETSRAKFIGRNNDKNAPQAIKNNIMLTNTVGAILDPIISLRKRVKLKPKGSCRIHFLTSFSYDREELIEISRKYSEVESINKLYNLSFEYCQKEMKSLNIKSTQGNLYQQLASKILFLNSSYRERERYIKKLNKGQRDLWGYGISGDMPMVLIVVREEKHIDIVRQVIDAHSYLRRKHIFFDLIILNLEPMSYKLPLQKSIKDLISSSNLKYLENKKGGVFLLSSTIPEEDINLFKAISSVIIDGDNGTLASQISSMEKENKADSQDKPVKEYGKSYKYGKGEDIKIPQLEYFNQYGGFGDDGKNYTIVLEGNQNTPTPWINVISNPNFGFLVSESGSAYTWFKNSRENKLTTWNNDYIVDPCNECIYISDGERIWSPTVKPIRYDKTYVIEHGFGYSKFIHSNFGITSEAVMFVPINENVKLIKLKLKNNENYHRKLQVAYYAEITMGVVRENTYKKIFTEIDNEKSYIYSKNPYNTPFKDTICYLTISGEEDIYFTGDRNEFLGVEGNIENPRALNYGKLENTCGAGLDPCLASMIDIKLKANEEREVIIIFGAEDNREVLESTIKKYRSIENVNTSLEEIKNYWNKLLNTIQVDTPDKSFNIMLNGWLMYQTICCRLWARSAFYQCGGAFGFRDQLQDVMAACYLDSEITKKQILYAASRQFEEGDVQHWWHPIIDSGIRTRFSDDLLWLPYVVNDYIDKTGDYSILDEEIYYLKDEELREGEDERYKISPKSELKESLYNHCLKAIEKSLKFGEHNIPLMGSGDWNDGMSTVGNKGKGESIWLGWFLYSILNKFKNICRLKGDEELYKKYKEMQTFIKKSLEENGWDGQWYRRAYFDDGTPLGSSYNEECRIDSLSQSWAIISGAGDKERAEEAMNNLYKYLVREDKGMILLLTPPFSKSKLEPGYIKGYIPGVRENGGQYTHASTWVILAFAKMGKCDVAIKLFNMINPINHSSDYLSTEIYKTEPYVMTADVYSVEPHVGRGGWSWYTGTSSWMYKVAIEGILGFSPKDGKGFTINPCSSLPWNEYEIKYRINKAVYNIKVKKGKEKSIYIDNKKVEDNFVPYFDEGEYNIEVTYK
ncbi:MAG: cyclic beta 1-2 glucan synthetase [Clostridium argentinense]|uniref:GH36-type glycosyl hydrolase domain-containing protein n=1 Tax=uncultured Clostridium sp. TaxID=59620 RepID=UPI001D5C5E52|nr:glucoamylase family protein [uncultured Clostridium sp.]MBS5822855.1 cyclic beta 1-2 glucan synthetase [Clostridium argentinense]MDU1349308.1 glucoamylase family protein [Clostridium argentinense]